VLILTSVVSDAMVDEAIRSGAHGYLLKEVDGRGLIQAIRDAAAGKSILDPAVTARVMQFVKAGGTGRDALAALSPQERRVLALIAEGCRASSGLKLAACRQAAALPLHAPPHRRRTHSASRAHACARWLIRFFTLSPSSAYDSVYPLGMNNGS
jgi:FixJ family two-component response regulator